jgi:hypothetical protein
MPTKPTAVDLPLVSVALCDLLCAPGVTFCALKTTGCPDSDVAGCSAAVAASASANTSARVITCILRGTL